MNSIKKWGLQQTARRMVKKLKEKSYTAYYADNLDEAKKLVLELIPKGSSIALGGSVTIGEMGLLEVFRGSDYRLFDRYQPLPYEEIYQIYRQSLLADFLVTSANAITEEGEIVCTDSSGNRTAGILLGPEKVIFVIGSNKVVADIPEAFRRIKRIAPLNARRIGHRTPCAESGVCENCQTPQRICNATAIVHHGMKHPGRYTVIMVADEVGF